MKSIMHQKDGTCYLCKKLYNDYSIKATEEHHVMFGPDRKLSEKYGLKVYLCLPHHRTSSEAVHQNKEMNILCRRDAQKEFIKKYPDKDWMQIFGKNYL